MYTTKLPYNFPKTPTSAVHHCPPVFMQHLPFLRGVAKQERQLILIQLWLLTIRTIVHPVHLNLHRISTYVPDAALSPFQCYELHRYKCYSNYPHNSERSPIPWHTLSGSHLYVNQSLLLECTRFHDQHKIIIAMHLWLALGI